jgi:hypothetical protein
MISLNGLIERVKTLGREITQFLKGPGISDGIPDPEYDEAMEYLNQTGDPSLIQDYLLKKAQEKKQGEMVH